MIQLFILFWAADILLTECLGNVGFIIGAFFTVVFLGSGVIIKPLKKLRNFEDLPTLLQRLVRWADEKANRDQKRLLAEVESIKSQFQRLRKPFFVAKVAYAGGITTLHLAPMRRASGRQSGRRRAHSGSGGKKTSKSSSDDGGGDGEPPRRRGSTLTSLSAALGGLEAVQ